MASKFSYKKRSYEEAKKQVNESDSGLRDGFISSSIQIFKPSEGTNKIRILPPTWEDADHYGYRMAIHYGIGPNNDAYICPYHTKNPFTGKSKLPCPICEEKARMQDEDEDYAKALRPVQRVLVFLLERVGKGAKPVIKAWAMPPTLDKGIMQQAIDDETQEVLAIDSPYEGYDLDIIREGTGLTTKYQVKVARKSSEIADFDDEILPLISDDKALPNALIFHDYDYLENCLSGNVVPDKSKEDKSSSKKAKKKAKNFDVDSMTYNDIFELTEEELLDLIEQESLKVDPENFSNELDELAEEIAKELGLRPKRKKEEEDKPKVAERKPVKQEPEESEDYSESSDGDDEEPEVKEERSSERLSRFKSTRNK